MSAQLAAAATLSAGTSTGEAVQFWILGTVAVIGALCTVFMKRAVHSALCLAGTMIVLAVFYLANGAYVLGIVQIVVYTGAIMMLFLFVLMLIGRDASDSLIETLRGQRMAAILLGVGFAGIVASALARGLGAVSAQGLDRANAGGNVEGIAALLFTRYVFAFEVTSALLITAAVGAMLLAHVERPRGTRLSQKERSRARFAPGSYPAMKAGPGVFATSDSVATPALLPDRQPAERSLTKVVAARELTAAEAAPKDTERQ
jgi:NADH-quinone oxidoreductase subunit J